MDSLSCGENSWAYGRKEAGLVGKGPLQVQI